MGFLPDDFDGIPQGPSNYMKFEEGENTFRALSDAITGYVYFVDQADGSRKPVRVKNFEDVPDKYKNNKDNRENAKYFWAFVVYNFKTKTIQILEIKQKGVMNDIETYLDNAKWGDIRDYNLVVKKTKTGSEARDVEYSVIAEPKEVLSKEIASLYEDSNVDLQALYKGEDPFQAGSTSGPETVDPNDIPEDLGEK